MKTLDETFFSPGDARTIRAVRLSAT